MGRNLARNAASQGFGVAVYDAFPAVLAEAMRENAELPCHKHLVGFTEAETLTKALATPQVLLLSVKAGEVTDKTIEAWVPHLQQGALIIDGGNSHPKETARRERELKDQGIRFLGMGISGGEEGARHGASLMPGGVESAFEDCRGLLSALAAKAVDGTPCVDYIGPGGAGHFTKMVHNGIEYGDMQLLAEAYDVLTRIYGHTPSESAAVFENWNAGPLESYLVQITAQVLRRVDDHTDRPLVDVIVDVAGQKGTGRWTAEAALELGVAAPTILAAVQARALSAARTARQRGGQRLGDPVQEETVSPDANELRDLHDALYAAKLCSYAQGFHLLDTASRVNDWSVRLESVALLWRAGCIIRAGFLDDVARAFRRNPELPHLLLDQDFGAIAVRSANSLRRVIALATSRGVPCLAFSSSLAWMDSMRTKRLPQNLTQAQRDAFGAHGFARIDDAGDTLHHVDWGIQSGG